LIPGIVPVAGRRDHVEQGEGGKMILKRVGIAVLLTACSFRLAPAQDSQSMIAA
jgi:hypothetical protein